MYVGIDVDTDNCHVILLDGNGEEIDSYRIDNTSKEITRLMQKIPNDAEIVLESSTLGKPIYWQLKKAGRNVHMAAPSKIALISQSKKKTDDHDSRLLADLLRLGYLPESYVPSEEIEELRKMVRYRKSLGEKCAVVKNQVHALLARNGIKNEFSDLFGRTGMRSFMELRLPVMEKIILEGCVREIGFLSEEINMMDIRLAEVAGNYKEIHLLMSIPGVDYYSAMVIFTEVGDVHRFPAAKKLVGYAGLAPRVYQSGKTTHYGHISKDGPSILRWVLTIAAQGAIKKPGKLQRFYKRLSKRKGGSKAIVATARKLLIIMYHMLMNHQEYEERDDDLTCRKIRRMNMKAKRMMNIKENGGPIVEKHKMLMEKGLKMLISEEFDVSLGTKQFS